MTVVPFHERSGFAVFVCTGCGHRVFAFAPPDREPVCQTCRWIAAHPGLPEDVKAMLKGVS